MTVQKDVTKNIYVGNGSTRTFPFTFECPAEHPEYIKVYLMQDDGMALATSDYQLDMDARQITYPSSGTALPEGKKLVIMRELPLQQMMNLVNNGPYFAEDVETAFDENVMAMQQIAEKLNRSIIMSVDIDGDDFVNEVPFEAGKSFRIADDGKSIVLTEDPGKVIDGAKALLEQTTEQAESANEAATNAQNAATTAEKIANDLGLVDEAVQTAVASATTASEKSDIATSKADIATAKAGEASASATNAAASAGAAKKSAEAAAKIVDVGVDPTLSVEGAAADSKVVGERLRQINPDANIQVVFMNGKFPTVKNYGFTVVGCSGFYIADLTTSSMAPFSFSDIAAQIPEYATWDADSQTFTLNLGNGSKRFGFDTSTNKFTVDSISNAKPYGLIVLYWMNYNKYGGKLAEQIATQLYLENKNEYFTNNSLQKDSFNASFHTGAKDFATVCKRYGMLFNGDEKNGVIAVDTCESFLWFTDPHLFTGHTDIGSIAIMEEYISQIQKYYNSTPTSFALCGGDWLGNSDTPDMACYKMGYINGICKSMFDKCYMLVGNHDTNYQGKKDANSPTYTTQLSRLAIRNLWYRDIGRAYYDFDGVNTHFYCFDTGNGSQTLEDNNGYGYEQATWFSEKLMNERYDHVAIAAHIYARNTVSGNTVPTDMPPLTRLLLQISFAYNQRSKISVNGKNYNFVDATGRVEFMLAGHSHQDYTLMDSGIRIIGTLDCGNHQSYTNDCSFDLVFVDYDNRKIKCIRAGVGEDREMNLDN
mgnify:CR=1 FL=1